MLCNCSFVRIEKNTNIFKYKMFKSKSKVQILYPGVLIIEGFWGWTELSMCTRKSEKFLAKWIIYNIWIFHYNNLEIISTDHDDHSQNLDICYHLKTVNTQCCQCWTAFTSKPVLNNAIRQVHLPYLYHQSVDNVTYPQPQSISDII